MAFLVRLVPLNIILSEQLSSYKVFLPENGCLILKDGHCHKCMTVLPRKPDVSIVKSPCCMKHEIKALHVLQIYLYYKQSSVLGK